MKRILITGASGLLGLNWAIHDCNLHHVILGIHERKIELPGTESVQLHMGNIDSAKESINNLKPDIIIHAAGYTSVEGCEKNPELARAINTDLASNISKVSAEFNIPLVHISTDHLFSGMTSLVTEDEPIDPKNVYGASKAEAELRVLENDPKALVIRTNFYGWGPSYRPSFSDMIIKSLRLGKRITLFEDVLYTPILAERLIETVHELLTKKAQGVFNVVSDEMISKYDFGLSIAECFDLDKTLIDKGKMIDMADLVKRPFNMSLSNKKVRQLLNHPLGSIPEHLRRLLEQEKTGLFNKIVKL
jgi:dTDP-4-dehydrorhamnose reductase